MTFSLSSFGRFVCGHFTDHNEMDVFGDIGGVITHALYVFGDKQMGTRSDIAVLHHIGYQFPENSV